MRTHHFDIGTFFVLQMLDVKLLRGALLQPLVFHLQLTGPSCSTIRSVSVSLSRILGKTYLGMLTIFVLEDRRGGEDRIEGVRSDRLNS